MPDPEGRVISLVTIPYTGTIYTLHLLRSWGIELERKHLENTASPPYGRERFGPDFPGPSSDEWSSYPEGRRVVCTLRDPLEAVISAMNRGIPNGHISVDGWAVMADWHERELEEVHFLPIPPRIGNLLMLVRFVGAQGADIRVDEMRPKNTSPDRTGLKHAYFHAGRHIPGNPTFHRAIDQLREMPLVEALFTDHGFPWLPWYKEDGP